MQLPSYIKYFLISVLSLAALSFVLAWHSDYSNELQLSNYGYDFDAMNDTERFQNVTQKNIEKVKQLKISRMGISWPLKAILGFFTLLPFVIVVFIGTYLFNRFRGDKDVSENNRFLT